MYFFLVFHCRNGMETVKIRVVENGVDHIRMKIICLTKRRKFLLVVLLSKSYKSNEDYAMIGTNRRFENLIDNPE